MKLELRPGRTENAPSRRYRSPGGTRLIALVGVLLLMVVSCSSDSSGGTTSASTAAAATSTIAAGATTTSDAGPVSTAAPVSVPPAMKIAMVGADGSPIFALHYVADGIGAFEEEIEQPFGVPVELVFGLSSPDAVTALAAGEVQVAGRGFVGAANALIQGAPIKAVGTFFEGLACMVVAHVKYEAERGTDITKFADSVWGTGSPGGVGEIAARGLAQQAGLDFSTFELVTTGDIPLQRSLLESGDMDIVAADSTTASVMIHDGLAYLLFNTMDPAQNQPIFGKQLGTFIMVGESFEEDYPEFALAFYRALGRAWQAIDEVRDDPQAVLDLYSPEVRARVNEEAFLAEWPQVHEAVHPISMSGEYLSDTVGFAVEQELLTEADWESIADRFDETLLMQAYEEVGVDVVRG
jgi:ABC-type nitrate/sulfonate/bicarbonate transport system substrate-binding protein